MAPILRNGGSQSPDRWLREPRNNHLTTALGWTNADSLPITLETQMKKILQDEPFVYNEGILHHEEGVDIIPTNIELSGMEISLVNARGKKVPDTIKFL